MTSNDLSNNDFTNHPLVTVGITCFNASDTIGRAIKSAINQHWVNLEVVVVDDCSTDNSVEIIQSFIKLDPRVKLICHENNQGCSSARNTILDNANGEYIAFFDDDDVSQSDRILRQIKHIFSYEEQHGTKDIACYCSGNRIYPNGYIKKLVAIGSNGKPLFGESVANYLLFNNKHNDYEYGAGTPTCSLMISTSLLKSIGGFDESLRRQEDIDLAIRLAFIGCHFTGITEPALSQYATLGSEKSAVVEYESTLVLIEKYKDYLLHHNSYFYIKLWTELRYRHFAGNDGLAVLVLMKLLLKYPLRTVKHFINSAFARFIHERKMRANHE